MASVKLSVEKAIFEYEQSFSRILTRQEYEKLTCAAIAAYESIPLSFVEGILDLEMNRTLPLDQVLK